MPVEGDHIKPPVESVAQIDLTYPNIESVELAATRAQNDPTMLQRLAALCHYREQMWRGSEVAGGLDRDYRHLASKLITMQEDSESVTH